MMSPFLCSSSVFLVYSHVSYPQSPSEGVLEIMHLNNLEIQAGLYLQTLSYSFLQLLLCWFAKMC